MKSYRDIYHSLDEKTRNRVDALIARHYKACQDLGMKSEVPPEVLLKEAIECAQVEIRDPETLTDSYPSDARSLEMTKRTYHQYTPPADRRSGGDE